MVALAAVVLTGLGGCVRTGPSNTASTPVSASATRAAVSAPPEAYDLASDGSVPWVDEPLDSRDVYPHSAPPSPPAGARPCRAKQLSGRLASWITPNHGVETPRGFDANISHLYGYVDLHNTSTTWCTLQGGAATTMVTGAKTIPMNYRHRINAQAHARVTGMPPDGHASLRLDWDGPFCVELTDQTRLAVELPHGGGTLQATLTTTERPACNPAAVKPTVKATLSSGGFDEAVDPTPIGPSPLQRMTAEVTGPASARPNERIVLRVTLTNPTDESIALRPCPAYGLELHASRDALGEPVNVRLFYQLNCRPTTTVPAHGALTFQIAAVVPRSLVPGRQLTVMWELIPREQTTGERVRGQLVVPVA
jgi:hypothetical protein